MGDSRKEQKKRIQYPQKVYKNSKVKIVNQVYINNFLNSDCVESTRKKKQNRPDMKNEDHQEGGETLAKLRKNKVVRNVHSA